MPRGGFRPNSGRKPGSPNKRKRRIVDRAAAEGITPVEFLLQTMRDETLELHVRMQAARDAAPFVHPRLAAISARADFRVAPIDQASIYVQEIHVVPVPSGRYLTSQEAAEPIIEALPETPSLAEELAGELVLDVDVSETPPDEA